MLPPRSLFVVLLVAILLVSACTPKAVTETPEPQIANFPSSGPTTTDSGPCPCFEGLSSGLDNATQARIRAINMVMGTPNIDVYVNGMPALNGGAAQGNIGTGKFSGFLYVAPGTYTIALVPHDGTMDQALFPPTEVKVEAGHRYTVAAMGQLVDNDIHPLVVDETTLEAGIDASLTDNIAIDINNMKGADSITEQAYGRTLAENIKYGEVRAWFTPSGTAPLKTLGIGETTDVIYDSDGFGIEPGISVVLPYYGPFPADNYDSIGNQSQGVSELNVPEFLAGFDGRDVNMDGHLITFKTFLNLVDKAGMRDELVNGGPYFLMAPTDEAFASLSQAEMDELLNDPQAIKTLLNAHIVDGYYPSGSLSGVVYGFSDKVLTNRLGGEVNVLRRNS